jgi:hypothetical protein
MARRRGKTRTDRGRNFYETSSPFETFVPGGKPAAPATLVDSTDLPRRLMTGPSGPAFTGEIHPEQFDNPRGYPGLGLVHTGTEKAKAPYALAEHSKLPRTKGGG